MHVCRASGSRSVSLESRTQKETTIRCRGRGRVRGSQRRRSRLQYKGLPMIGTAPKQRRRRRRITLYAVAVRQLYKDSGWARKGLQPYTVNGTRSPLQFPSSCVFRARVYLIRTVLTARRANANDVKSTVSLADDGVIARAPTTNGPPETLAVLSNTSRYCSVCRIRASSFGRPSIAHASRRYLDARIGMVVIASEGDRGV